MHIYNYSIWYITSSSNIITFIKKFFSNLINVSLRLEFVRQFLLWNIVLQVWSFLEEFCLNNFLGKRKRSNLEYYNGIVIAFSFKIVFRTKDRIMYAKRQFKIQIESISIYVLKQKILLLGFQFFIRIRYLIRRFLICFNLRFSWWNC